MRWGHRSAELFFVGLDRRLMRVPATFAGVRASLGQRSALFTTSIDITNPGTMQPYIVSNDDQEFLMGLFIERPVTSSVIVMLNWRARP